MSIWLLLPTSEHHRSITSNAHKTTLQNDHPASRNSPQIAQIKQKIALVWSRGLTLACSGLFHDTKPCLMCDSLKLKYRWCAVIDVTTSQNGLRLKILSDYLVSIRMHVMYPDQNRRRSFWCYSYIVCFILRYIKLNGLMPTRFFTIDLHEWNIYSF